MSSSEVKVGAFALGGAVVLAGIITFMGAFSFGKKGYELRINYPQVSGLMPGHVVRYAGVQVGTVKKINVAPDKVEVIKYFNGKVPILGVCLGHQAICEVYGATITYAKKLMHGKMSVAALDTECPVFAGIGETAEVARYHSLIAQKETIPECLQVIATTDDGEVMGVKHKEAPTYGLQFHPESILTPKGIDMLKNFLKQ